MGKGAFNGFIVIERKLISFLMTAAVVAVIDIKLTRIKGTSTFLSYKYPVEHGNMNNARVQPE